MRIKMAPFRRLLPTAYRSFAPNASVQKRARTAHCVPRPPRAKREGSKSDGKLPLQDLFVLRAGRRDDDGLRRDDERALRRGRALEHLLDHGLERGHDRHHVRHAGATGGQVSHVFLEQFFDVFGEHDAFLLVVFELAVMIAKRMEKIGYPQIYERLINFIASLDIGARKD